MLVLGLCKFKFKQNLVTLAPAVALLQYSFALVLMLLGSIISASVYSW